MKPRITNFYPPAQELEKAISKREVIGVKNEVAAQRRAAPGADAALKKDISNLQKNIKDAGKQMQITEANIETLGQRKTELAQSLMQVRRVSRAFGTCVLAVLCTILVSLIFVPSVPARFTCFSLHASPAWATLNIMWSAIYGAPCSCTVRRPTFRVSFCGSKRSS